jgi:hypothetical protein
MILQLVGLVVVVALIAAGAVWLGKNVRFGSDKIEKSQDEKEK